MPSASGVGHEVEASTRGGGVMGSLYDAVAPDLIKVVLQNLWKGHEYFVVFAEVSEEVE